MEFFKQKTSIAFLDIKWKTFAVSMIALISSLFCLYYYGLNLSLDFTGGTQIELTIPADSDVNQAKAVIKRYYPSASIQNSGNAYNLMIKIPSQKNLDHGNVQSKFESMLKQPQIHQVVSLGPQIGKDLFLNGLNALFFALLVTMAYITLRFESKFALSAMIALLHDPIITLGFFSLTQTEFDAVSLAGLLTVLGYSLNDTVVVYDRIRENFQKNPKESTETIINCAINETLSRTIITSGLTLIAVITLCIFGGDSLWGFSLALCIGILVGTYSSIYVAGACAVLLGLKLDSDQIPDRSGPKLINT